MRLISLILNFCLDRERNLKMKKNYQPCNWKDFAGREPTNKKENGNYFDCEIAVADDRKIDIKQSIKH